GAVCKNAAGISRLVRSGRFQQRIHARRQMIRPGIRREGDLRNADLGRRAIDHSTLEAGVRGIRLPQIRPTAAYLFGEHARGFAHGAASKHDGAGSKRAESVWSNRSIAVADGNPCGIDPQLMRGDLRKRCLVPLAMILHAYVDQNAAVRQHADICRLVTRDYAKLAFDELHGPVTALLGVKRKSHANPSSVGLARRLPLADGWEVNFVARDIKRGNIVPSVELQTGRGLVRKFSGGDDVLPSQVKWLTPQFACNFVDQAFNRKRCAWPGHPTIRTHRSLVRGNGVG